MIEIRRIAEQEAAAVTALWDRLCRETPDGGPLSERGSRNIARMLAMSDTHRDSCCLVAVDVGTEEMVGFVCCEVDSGPGLLPGVAGWITELYVVAEARGGGTGGGLAGAALRWLREQGAGTVRTLICIDAADRQRFWADAGFMADMVCMSCYPDG